MPISGGGQAMGADPLGSQAKANAAIDQCTTLEDLLPALLEQAASIYPCLNWLFGEITSAAEPVEVEILAYSPTRLKSVYQGMRLPVLQSTFSHRLYEEQLVSYVGEDNGTLSLLNPQFVETFALTSFLGVPLLFDGEIIGILYAATFKGEKPSVPTELQQEALRNLAQMGALALHRISERPPIEPQ